MSRTCDTDVCVTGRQVTARGGPHWCQVKWRLSSGTDRNNERVAMGSVNQIIGLRVHSDTTASPLAWGEGPGIANVT